MKISVAVYRNSGVKRTVFSSDIAVISVSKNAQQIFVVHEVF